MNRLITIAVCLAFPGVLVAGCGGDDSKKSSSATTTTTSTTTAATQQEAVPAVVEVSIGDNFYKPEDITIKKGQSIKWKNDGAVAHTVTSDSNSSVKFDSSTLNPKAVYALKPTAAGKLSYYCTIHGQSQSGTITVTR
jgi:plastocyanin